eukprot:TRINITY_DN1198_c1_g1_i1.p1 TRINITY_DN1198_c1_g1~~TRINITY_DN1198_c1_g1_i1.p1  ORF type:complete len:539 (+),score=153.51 TRINITY_DN1198_c1_g1_i1:225-1841(+)
MSYETTTSTQASGPSRVIHFRNVGPDINQHDILVLANSFGPVEQVLMLKGKNQALVQYQTTQGAIGFMQYYAGVQAHIRGRNVYPQYSSHQELASQAGVLSSSSSSSSSSSATTSGGSLGSSSSSSRNTSSNNTDLDSSSSNMQAQLIIPPNRILLVTISNAIYPITADILYQVFGTHGGVEKIVIFNKAKGLQALIQYSSIPSATSAKDALQSQNIYTNGSCQLHIQYSNLQQELTVTANSERTKDFTKPLPSIPSSPSSSSSVDTVRSSPHHHPSHHHHHHHHHSPASHHHHHPSHPPVPPPPSVAAPGPEHYNNNNYQQMGQYGPMAVAGYMSASQFNSVLLVSNLCEEKTTCPGMFNLFSNYGNVLRVKILHNKPDHCLVQMGDYFQASTAMHYLKGIHLFDKQMDINFSKHAYITSNDSSDPTCADFTNSPLNRFKFTQGSEKAQQIYKHMSGPGPLLHVSNLPSSASHQSISDMFTPFGTITALKVFEYNNKQQALIQFSTIQSATEALVTLHNTPLDSGRGLKVSFSKNKL